MSEAERRLARGDLAEGAKEQARALEEVERAKADLADRVRRLRDAEQRTREELARAQRSLVDRAAKAEEATRALRPKSEEARSAAAEAAAALERAKEAMGGAERSTSGGDGAGASASQSQAGRSLDEAAAALGKVAQDRDASADASRRLKELQAEQEDIRRRVKELDDLLKKAEEPEAASAAQGAVSKMQETEGRLESGSGERAAQSAEEARRYLEEAREALDRERRRYESLRQEEALFRLLNDLKEFRKAEQRIRDETAELSDAAAQGPLVRPKKRRVRALSQEQKELAERVGTRQQAVAEEESVVFSTALALVQGDMTEVSLLLEDERLGPLVLGMQDGVLHGLSNLIAGFEDEIERRRQPESQGGGGGGGQPRPRLVPPSAEIKLLRRMQNDLNAKVEAFWRDNPGVREGALDERQRRTVERLYHQQGRLASDLEKLMKSVFRDAGEER